MNDLKYQVNYTIGETFTYTYTILKNDFEEGGWCRYVGDEEGPT
jgi:hypothetical protein